MAQFSLRRLLVSTALIAVGCGMFADLWFAGRTGRPFDIQVVEALCSWPLIGAGLFALIKRPILGAFIGLVCFVAFLIWLTQFTGLMSP